MGNSLSYMNDATDTRQDGRHSAQSILLLVALAMLGVAHILVRTSTYGAAIGGDSVTYLSLATNVTVGAGWQDFRGMELLPWPPLFPLLLSTFGRMGADLLTVGRVVNAVAFGLIILVSGWWLRRTLNSHPLAISATAAIMTSYPLSHISSFILTEPLFILFTLLALVSLESFLDRRTTWPSLIAGAGFAALAAVTRYPGVAVIFTGTLLLTLRWNTPLGARLRHGVTYGAIASAPLAAVLVYNWVVFGVVTYRTYTLKAGQSVADSLGRIIEVFSRGIVPLPVPDWAAYLLWTAGVLAGTAGYIHSLRQEAARSIRRLRPALPFGTFAAAYLIFMVAALPWSSDVINPRYLVPLVVPLMLGTTFLLDRFLSICTTGWRSVGKWAAALLVLVGGLVNVGTGVHMNLKLTAEGLESGYIGNTFNTLDWKNSETIRYLKANPVETRIYCNVYGILHYMLAIQAGMHVRGKYPTLPHELDVLLQRIENGAEDAYIVWLKRDDYDVYEFDLRDLRALPSVETVADLSDGVIFRLGPGEKQAGSSLDTRSKSSPLWPGGIATLTMP